MSSNRDLAMDYLKGLACLMMVLGHLPVYDKTDMVAQYVVWCINSATVVFFGISGVNAVAQAAKYPFSYLFGLNLALFVFGTAYSTIIHVDLYERYLLEIFQIIAIGSVLAALLYRLIGNRPWVFAFVGLLVALAKYGFAYFWPDFHGGGVLLVHENYRPHIQLAPNEARFFPGFPFFPWAYIFFWGVFAYHLSQRAQAVLLLTEIAILAGGLYLDVLGDWREKWGMSPAFLLVSMIFFSAHCFVVRFMPAHWLKVPGFILLFGQNSLAFLFVHGFGLLAGMIIVKTTGQFGAWALAYVVTYFGLVLFVKWKPWKLFDASWTWWLMAGIVVTLPLVAITWPVMKFLVVLSEAFLGILFAKHFGQLRNLIAAKLLPEKGKKTAPLAST